MIFDILQYRHNSYESSLNSSHLEDIIDAIHLIKIPQKHVCKKFPAYTGDIIFLNITPAHVVGLILCKT